MKRGFLGRKHAVNFDEFSISEELNLSKLYKPKNLIIDSKYLDLRSLYPSLLNRYTRKYFLSSDGRFRATLDHDQSFYNLFQRPKFNRLPKPKIDKASVILELKYAYGEDKIANKIISELPYRVTKSSKYVTGMQKTLVVR